MYHGSDPPATQGNIAMKESLDDLRRMVILLKGCSGGLQTKVGAWQDFEIRFFRLRGGGKDGCGWQCMMFISMTEIVKLEGASFPHSPSRSLCQSCSTIRDFIPNMELKEVAVRPLVTSFSSVETSLRLQNRLCKLQRWWREGFSTVSWLSSRK